MVNDNKNLSLSDAAANFLSSLLLDERKKSQPEIYRFIRWYGRDRLVTALKALEVARYAKQLSPSDADYSKKLEMVKSFLRHAMKEGWTNINLAVHLKANKGKTQTKTTTRVRTETISLTSEGHAELEATLAVLKEKRPYIINEIRKAAADKDFRENAPLEAARQEHGHLEGRIRELERTLKSAVIIEGKEKITSKVQLGDTVVLREITSEKEQHYVLVNPREVDPGKGKISNLSPMGRAITGQEQGKVVDVNVPAGKLRYEIKRICR